MKTLFYSFILLLLTGCISGEERYICTSPLLTSNENVNHGLIIKNNKISFSALSDVPFCRKEGLLNIYSYDCSNSTNKNVTFIFDTVSHQISQSFSGISITSLYQCKKVN